MSVFVVNYAVKLGTCKECNEQITKGELRIGRKFSNPRITYYHPEPICFIRAEQARSTRGRKKNIDQGNSIIQGLDLLQPNDKVKMLQLWQLWRRMICSSPSSTSGTGNDQSIDATIDLTVDDAETDSTSTSISPSAAATTADSCSGAAALWSAAPPTSTSSHSSSESSKNPRQDDEPTSSCKRARLEKSESVEVCSVCLDPPKYPVTLPCGHTFCFLCVKGLTVNATFDVSSLMCSLCRAPFPFDYLHTAKVLSEASRDLNQSDATDDWDWFYEGKKGWWRFESRNSEEIEESFLKGEKSLETMICGTIYVIDFTSMQQYQKNYPIRKRRIKRDLRSSSSIGVAGLQKRN